MDEISWDKLLRIKTTGRDDTNADTYYYPYEPTPYVVLERLAGSGFFSKKNTLIDYGCGKGRVDFYLAYQTKCRCIGVEYDERMLEKAVENQKEGAGSGRTTFVLENAKQYVVPDEVDRCYFFNPFSVEVLHTVLQRVKESHYRNDREMLLFFYYPSDEYVAHLMQEDELDFFDEIPCQDLFDGNDPRERILIFRY